MNIIANQDVSIEFLQRASRVLKSLGHPVRLEIVKFLQDGERSVTEIQIHVKLAQAITSQHLRKMYKTGIVTFHREGTTCYYSLANDFIRKLLACFSECDQKFQSGEWSLDWFGVE